MRVTVVDGTPSEIAEYAERTGLFTQPENSASRHVVAPNSNLDPKVVKFVEDKAGSHATRRQFVEMYLERVSDIRGVDVEIGTSSKTKNGLNHYLMIRDSGPRRFGAVAYVRPSTAGVTFRLPPDAAEGCNHAKARNLSGPDRTYQVICHLRSEAAVQEAVDLTSRALEIVRRKEQSGEGR